MSSEKKLVPAKKKAEKYVGSIFRSASEKCASYYYEHQTEGQDYGALMSCEHITRAALREKRNANRIGSNRPTQYVKTEEDAMEYFELFKEFFRVYRGYLNKEAEESE